MEQQAQFSKPPEDFNPCAASNRDLVKYGYPPRPDKTKCPALFKRWEKVMSRPLDLQLAEPKLGDVDTTLLSKKGTVNNNAFAGVEFTQIPNGSPLSTITASWAIPNANIPVSLRGNPQAANSQFTVSVWVGLDVLSVSSSGTGGGTGIEAGTTSTVTTDAQGNVAEQSAVAWYRTDSAALQTPLSALPVSPGDVVAFSVCQATGSGTGVNVYGANLSSGKASAYLNDDITATGYTAYCFIGSVLGNNSSFPPTVTADFADAFLFGIGARDQNSTEYNLNSTNLTIVNDYSSTTTPLATSTIVSPQVLEVSTSQS